VVPLIERGAPLIAAAVVLGCAFQYLATEEYEETFSTAGYSAMQIAGIDGDIQLRGLPGTSWVTMRGTAEAIGGTDARARSNLEHARLRVRTGDGGALLLVFDPPIDKVGLVDLELDRLSELPADLGLTLRIDEGDITVTGQRGPLVLETADGDVTATASGSIAIIAGGAAEVSIDEITPRRVDVETADGEIRLALPDQSFEIFCYPDGGAVSVDQQGFDDIEIDQLNDGTVVVRSGSTTATDAKTIELRSHGREIRIEHRDVE
jgi:hypothetical protein